jgi:hypothetical protein
VDNWPAGPRLDTPCLLPGIGRPVIVFAGIDDQVVKSLGKKLAPLADNRTIQMHVMEGADHSFCDLYADELVEAALAFVEEQ